MQGPGNILEFASDLPPPTNPVIFIWFTWFLTRWGRWREILAHAFFKRHVTEKHVEEISRAMVCVLDSR